MEKILNFIKSHYFLIFILATANLIIAFVLVKTPLWENGDMTSYLEAMNLLQDKPYGEEFTITRLLTSPLMLYSSIFLGKLFNSNQTGMLAVNIIFYFLTVYVFCKIVESIFQNKKISLVASVLFFANYCMFNYGTTYRVDMGGWFFFLLTTLFAIKYYQSQLTDRKYFLLAIFAASVGVLFKEYGALGMISLGLLILLSKITLKQKIKKILLAVLIFLIIPGLYHLLIYLKFDYSYFSWYGHSFGSHINNPENPFAEYNLILFIKVLGWLFLAGWPIFLWGLYQLWKNYDKQRIICLAALLPASLAFLAWPALTQRIAFILVPWLALIAGFGLSKIKYKYLIIIILIIYALVNYLTRPWLLSAINL